MTKPLHCCALLGAVCLAASCGASGEEPKKAPAVTLERRDVPAFSFATLDGQEVSSQSLMGRNTIIAFVATYDLASQAQARFLATLERNHTPRINAAILVLDPPQNLPLAQYFVRTLGIRFPAALVDEDTRAGHGAFPGLHHVPSVVVLDRRGRERYRHVGLVELETLEGVLRTLERAASGAVER